ncbi:MAG: MFS transporter [Bacteroidales bacterium]|nr:MFS transporter [Bacteroidales bacterium]
MALLDFYKTSAPSVEKVPADRQDKVYKRLRFQTFISGTLAYALFYVCRLSLGVMKQPMIDEGLLTATQLGIIGACLYWAYSVAKLINGFLVDHSNIKRFMATGLIISVMMNLGMGILGASAAKTGISNSVLFVAFAVMWAINGCSQSLGAPCAIVGLTRWYPRNQRGTYYGFFSASHNFGEGLSFIFVGALVAAFGWKWGFFGAAAAGVLGVMLILMFLHDTTESKGLPSIEVLSGEAEGDAKESRDDVKKMQKAVIRNAGVWILAISSAFMYMSRYAINEWGIIFLQKVKDYDLGEAATVIGINPIFGIIGTVFSGWLSDAVFKGDRKYPAFVAGILEALALALFLFGGPSKWVNVTAMVLFGIAIGVLISFLGGLMAIDIVPRKATGAALGIVGMASYAAAGLQNVVTGLLLDGMSVKDASGAITEYNFTYVAWFWFASAVIAFVLPVLNWRRKQAEV